MDQGVLLENFIADPLVAGYWFSIPLPHINYVRPGPGVYLILYGSGGQWHLIDVDHADDVLADFLQGRRRDCWDRIWRVYPVPAIAVHSTALPGPQRERIVKEIRQAYSGLPCG